MALGQWALTRNGSQYSLIAIRNPEPDDLPPALFELFEQIPPRRAGFSGRPRHYANDR